MVDNIIHETKLGIWTLEDLIPGKKKLIYTSRNCQQLAVFYTGGNTFQFIDAQSIGYKDVPVIVKKAVKESFNK